MITITRRNNRKQVWGTNVLPTSLPVIEWDPLCPHSTIPIQQTIINKVLPLTSKHPYPHSPQKPKEEEERKNKKKNPLPFSFPPFKLSQAPPLRTHLLHATFPPCKNPINLNNRLYILFHYIFPTTPFNI